jgi:hypothetical protein
VTVEKINLTAMASGMILSRDGTYKQKSGELKLGSVLAAVGVQAHRANVHLFLKKKSP